MQPVVGGGPAGAAGRAAHHPAQALLQLLAAVQRLTDAAVLRDLEAGVLDRGGHVLATLLLEGGALLLALGAADLRRVLGAHRADVAVGLGELAQLLVAVARAVLIAQLAAAVIATAMKSAPTSVCEIPVAPAMASPARVTTTSTALRGPARPLYW